MVRALPPGRLIAFYGDDFTGSSAAMEAAQWAGIDTVLFLAPPTPARLAAFQSYRGIGIAGLARARSPAWMREHLPPIFSLLRTSGAPIVHYKVCSTFDSAPEIGSIGCAIDCAAPLFPGWMPMIVADHGMGRWQAFGHLFAQAHGVPYRLDRHPVMARHPTTPMDEADLGRHLARQTSRRIGLVDFVAMKKGDGDARLAAELSAGAEVISLDVLDQETLEEAGRLVWERGSDPVFAIGSQGVEAALAAWWRKAGLLPAAPRLPAVAPVRRIACVSGSVSPVTAAQIAHARVRGFSILPLEAAKAVDPPAFEAAIAGAVQAALSALSDGRDVLITTAEGPDDPATARFRDAVAASGQAADAVNDRVGAGLGQVLDLILATAKLSRVVVSGGDTSGRAAGELGIDALTAIAPLAAGSPLCRAYSDRPERDGLEITLKGGQVGLADFFVAAKGS
jgi:uncharacterized protein YgbK (DUF1537 family)